MFINRLINNFGLFPVVVALRLTLFHPFFSVGVGKTSLFQLQCGNNAWRNSLAFLYQEHLLLEISLIDHYWST
jgi:hypothetical protein